MSNFEVSNNLFKKILTFLNSYNLLIVINFYRFSVQIKKNLPQKHTKNQSSLKKFQKKREFYGANSRRKIILDKTLIKFIARDLQPLCILNDIGFQKFVYELNSRYTLPSQPTVTNVLIPKMYQEVKEKIATILNTVK